MLRLLLLQTALLTSMPGFADPLEVVTPESVGMSSERLGKIQERLQQLVVDQKTGGFQVLISRRGQVVMYDNIGWADVDDQEPMTDATLFRMYSMTKPVTAVAMMMHYEDGKYALNDPLSKHIPEFAGLKVFVEQTDDGEMVLVDPDREPTIEDLLRHTAGFTYGWFGDTPVDRIYKAKKVLDYDDSLQDLIDKLADTPLMYQPGERWHYSVAADVQAYLIEKWSGLPAGEFLAKRLFQPLGMDQTMLWVRPEDAELLADIYTHAEDGALVEYRDDLATNHLRAPGGFGGGAQLVSTSDDYWLFCQMLLNMGEFAGQRFLAPSTVKLMTTNRLPDGVTLNSGARAYGYNLGVVIDPAKDDFPLGDGEYWWDGLVTTLFWIDPQEEIVVILLTQYLPWSAQYYNKLMHQLVHAAIID